LLFSLAYPFGYYNEKITGPAVAGSGALKVRKPGYG